MTRNRYYCPRKISALTLADDQLLSDLNNWFSENEITNNSGTIMGSNNRALLVNIEAHIAYPMNNGIPQLLPQLATSLKGFKVGNTVD